MNKKLKNEGNFLTKHHYSDLTNLLNQKDIISLSWQIELFGKVGGYFNYKNVGTHDFQMIS